MRKIRRGGRVVGSFVGILLPTQITRTRGEGEGEEEEECLILGQTSYSHKKS